MTLVSPSYYRSSQALTPAIHHPAKPGTEEKKSDSALAVALETPPTDIRSISTNLGDLKVTDSMSKDRLLGLKPWMKEFASNLPALPPDPLSNAEPEKAVTTHLNWQVRPVFDQKKLCATAIYTYDNKIEGNDRLVLDISNLTIGSVVIDGRPAKYEIAKSDQANKPSALIITIPKEKGKRQVGITYSTGDSTSIFWINKEYTEGKKHPLLYTLFQPNEGASAIPGQHTPCVRLTYEVDVYTGDPELMALSSVSNNPQMRNESGIYTGMHMKRAVPLYLLSLHVGNFNFRPYSDGRTGVYAEEAMLDRTHKGFEKLPEFMRAAEQIFGPYEWGKYNPIVLGWAFPYMGMEHPCASTCGAVCLEQPSVLPHELAHSWTGNEVTNCNWQEFFWNEGATVFAEYLILKKIWGTGFAAVNFMLLLKETYEAMDHYRETNPDLLRLVNQTPTSEFTRIPYGKGALFFFMLSEAIGENFPRFMRDYIKVFSQNTMCEARFLAFLKLWLKNELNVDDFEAFKAKHKIAEWLHGLDIPDNAPVFTSELYREIENQAENAIKGVPVNEKLINGWDVTLKVLFLSFLAEKKITKTHLEALDKQMHFSETTSMSIKGEWAKQCAAAGLFTNAAKQIIVSYVVERNSIHETNKIAMALSKSEEGHELIREILKTENGRLFPLVRKVLEDKLPKA